MKFLSTVVVLSLILSGCKSEDIESENTTQIRFTKAMAAASDTLQAGIIVYAVNDDGLGTRTQEFFDGESVDTASSQLLSLPNGDWKFYAVGSAATLPMSSGGPLRDDASIRGIYCGIANNGNTVSLTGGEQTISISLTQSNCADSIFTPSDFVNTTTDRPYDVTVIACTSAEYNAIDKTASFVSASACSDVSKFSGKSIVYGLIAYPALISLSALNELEDESNDVLQNMIDNASILGCNDVVSSTLEGDADEIPFGNISGDNAFFSPLAFYAGVFTGTCASIQAENEVDGILLPRGIIDADEGESATSIFDDEAIMFADDANKIVNIFVNSTL